MYLSSFSHITRGFYESSGMHGGTVDVDAWTRETERDDERRFRALKDVLEGRSVLDFGCGNGGFVRKAGAAAARAAGVEPDTALRQYFHDEGLEVYADIGEASGEFDVITLFHVLEHLPDPRAVLSDISRRLGDGGRIIVEVPNSRDALLEIYGCEPFSRFTYWSCHLFLFGTDNLATLAGQAGLGVEYIRQVQRYPLSNHLYWLAKGLPGGHREWGFLDSPELERAYEERLAAAGCCDTLLASLYVDGGR